MQLLSHEMPLPFAPPIEPMLSEAQDEIPIGEGWGAIIELSKSAR